MAGPDKGKQGIINQIVEERNWVFVEGLNWKYITYGKTKTFPGIVAREERPLLVSKTTKSLCSNHSVKKEKNEKGFIIYMNAFCCYR